MDFPPKYLMGVTRQYYSLWKFKQSWANYCNFLRHLKWVCVDDRKSGYSHQRSVGHLLGQIYHTFQTSQDLPYVCTCYLVPPIVSPSESQHAQLAQGKPAESIHLDDSLGWITHS